MNKTGLNSAFGVYLKILAALYVFLGYLGTILIRDEFDHDRLVIFAVIVTPLAVALFLLGKYLPNWHQNYFSIFLFLAISLFVSASVGTLSLLNALAAPQNPVRSRVSVHRNGFVAEKREGAFGILFQYRF